MWLRFGSLAFFAVLAGGCVVDAASEGDLVGTAEDEAHEAVSDEGALGTASQALTLAIQAFWKQGELDVPLGSDSDRVCFLRGIQGNFAGFAEKVEVYRKNGSWYLGGASAQTGVAAWAACALTPSGSYSSEYHWFSKEDNLPTLMGSATKRVCFFTRIHGAFNSSSDWVHAYISGGNWHLTGDTNGIGVNVWARCVDVDTYSPPESWSSSTGDPATHMGLYENTACALTKLWGAFDSSQDKVRCYATAGSWYLEGTGAPGLGAYARTF